MRSRQQDFFKLKPDSDVSSSSKDEHSQYI